MYTILNLSSAVSSPLMPSPLSSSNTSSTSSGSPSIDAESSTFSTSVISGNFNLISNRSSQKCNYFQDGGVFLALRSKNFAGNFIAQKTTLVISEKCQNYYYALVY